MNRKEFQVYLKTLDYDELMIILSIVLAESTKRMADEAMKRGPSP